VLEVLERRLTADVSEKLRIEKGDVICADKTEKMPMGQFL
jgi:hypothetical protein